MQILKWGAAALAVAVLSTPFALADEPKSGDGQVEVKAEVDSGAKEKKTKKPARLIKPWRDVASLTPEQSDKIREIHAKALADIKAIREREEQEILGLLTDEQKKEVSAVTEQEKASRKTKKTAKADDEMSEEAGS